MRTQEVNPVAAASKALQTRRNEQIVFLVVGSQAKRQPQEHRAVDSSPVQVTVPTASSQCGGSLPPCYVMMRESGGSYTAYNPNGCSSFCYGKWQFSADWGGKLGLPLDIRQATPEQQDAAARELWANGAGCSHWNAC